MQLPDEAPKLPKLPFLIGDGVLLATAWFIARQSSTPLGPTPTIAIAICVGLGAILAVIPFIAEYARKQEEALQERQNALEALSRTTATAAEQISIAASGLHTIVDLAQKNLKAAEQVGPRIQEKIAEFRHRADEALVAENEALTQEVNTLRASEAERLETAADKIRTTAEALAKLETATHQHLSAVSTTLARLPEMAQEAAKAMVAIQTDAVREATARATAELESRVALAAGQLAARAEAAVSSVSVPMAPATAIAEVAPVTTPAAEPKRKRQPKSEPAPEAVPPASDAPASPEPTPAESVPTAAAAVTAEPSAATADVAPVPEAVADAVPAAPAPVETAPEPAVETPAASRPAEGSSPAVETEADPAAKPARKPRKPANSTPPFLPGLLNAEAPISGAAGDFSGSGASPDLPETSASSEERAPNDVERSLSADGLTRLMATAYIGIGNKLFVRGDGPGLSWDKGVPLQFVSIGKWRWETADATTPTTIKLYKNDQVECTALGSVTIDPGQQAEVVASF